MDRSKASRLVAGAAALCGWAGLVLQLALLLRAMDLAAAIWRFVGYFTILTNIGAAAVATGIAFGRNGRGNARAQLPAATSILVVGIVYTIALRGLWTPSGLQRLADLMLHDATPLLWLILWWTLPRRGLQWRDVAWALGPPLLYCVYALVRGAGDGWYAYWFLDASRQSAFGLAASVVGLSCLFGLVAALLVALRRPRALKETAPTREIVDEAGEESFPASDPPAWTLGEDRR